MLVAVLSLAGAVRRRVVSFLATPGQIRLVFQARNEISRDAVGLSGSGLALSTRGTKRQRG